MGQTKDLGQGTQGLGLRHKEHLTPDAAHRDTDRRYQNTSRGNRDAERTLDMPGSDRGHGVACMTLDKGLESHRSSDMGLVLRCTDLAFGAWRFQSRHRSAAQRREQRQDDMGATGHKGTGWHMD